MASGAGLASMSIKGGWRRRRRRRRRRVVYWQVMNDCRSVGTKRCRVALLLCTRASIGGGEFRRSGRRKRRRKRRRRRRRKVYSKLTQGTRRTPSAEEEEESLFKADAVNEEDAERDRSPGVADEFRRATFLRETHPYPSSLRYCVSTVVSTSTSEHQADEGVSLPAVQVRGECSFGASRDSLLAQLGPHGSPE